MSTNAGPYDTSRMYRSGSHVMKEDESAPSPTPPVAEVDRMGEAANAILACGECLASARETPPSQRAAVEVLRQEIRALIAGLSLLAAARARSHRIE
ncbi:MAG TPA: hypothetical protein VFT38_09675 [Vicinamibacteria bacterium]|nr:hypothetical protein [Vicinamibacteria bacterium]